MGWYYPDDISGPQLCHMEGHDYGGYDRMGKRKPISTCRNCYEQNHQYKGYIGYVTRKSKEWGCSWVEAEDRLEQIEYEKYEKEVAHT